GEGKIGGKAAGMLLASKILQRHRPGKNGAPAGDVRIPESYFVGTDMLYEFHRLNNLEQYMNQKYRQAEDIRAEYPRIVEAHMNGVFPQSMVEQLEGVLAQHGKQPLIVRSSSLLEDNFG